MLSEKFLKNLWMSLNIFEWNLNVILFEADLDWVLWAYEWINICLLWSRPYKSVFKQEIFSHGIHNGGACFLDYLREKPRTAKVNNAGKNDCFSKEYRSYLLDVKGKASKQWGQILYEVFNNKVHMCILRIFNTYLLSQLMLLLIKVTKNCENSQKKIEP